MDTVGGEGHPKEERGGQFGLPGEGHGQEWRKFLVARTVVCRLGRSGKPCLLVSLFAWRLGLFADSDHSTM